MSNPHGQTQSPFSQPKAVWAVALACVVSFMGVGLVDPILPSISEQLGATKAQTSLLLCSYLLITALAMIVTGWVSSRIGGKKTLMLGLILIVLAAAAAGASGSINEIVAFRGAWGLGNALFISTSLAVIVASSTGGYSGAIVLYETALGGGIAVGPLLGGFLGQVSWRGPFIGVAFLMAMALLATITLVQPTPIPAKKIGVFDSLKALRIPSLRTLCLAAICYNWAFFSILGFAPYPMYLSPVSLGFVFFGWGVLLGIFAVFVAPRLAASVGPLKTMYVNFAVLAVVLLAMGILVNNRPVYIGVMIVSGAMCGISNTMLTTMVMGVTEVERPVVSSTYGVMRFLGGGVAPYVASRLAEQVNFHIPFVLAAVVTVIGLVLLALGGKHIGADEAAEESIQVRVEETDLPMLPAGITASLTDPAPDARPVVLAIDNSGSAERLTRAAAQYAQLLGRRVEILHVVETDIVGEQAVDRETIDQATEFIKARLAQLADEQVYAVGHILRSVSDHSHAGTTMARMANTLGAQIVITGAAKRSKVPIIIDSSATRALIRACRCDVMLVQPEAEQRVREPALA